MIHQLDNYAHILESYVPHARPRFPEKQQWSMRCPSEECPCETESHKHFHVNPQNGRGVCFRCGLKTSIEWFLHLLTGQDRGELQRAIFGDRSTRISRLTKDLLLRVTSEYNIEDDVESIPTLKLPPYSTPVQRHPYFSERRVQPEVAARMDLRICAQGSYRDYVVTPIKTGKHQIVGFAGRALFPHMETQKRFSSSFPRNKMISNEQNFLQNNPYRRIVLVEGEFGDTASVMRVTPHVGATFGKNLVYTQAVRLYFLGIRSTYLFWDKTVSQEDRDCAISTLYNVGFRVYDVDPKMMDHGDPGTMTEANIRECLNSARRVKRIDYNGNQ